jgi:cyanophycinase
MSVGPLAFVGGGEWQEGCTFDAELLTASGGSEVVLLPTADAYEHPEVLVQTATSWFEGLGATVRALDVLRRPDALVEEHVTAVREARFLYLSGDSPMHLRSVVKDTPLWDAVVDAWQGGAVLAASAGAARLMGDPMVDPRGGAFTLGMGLVSNLAVIPHHDKWTGDRAHRTLRLSPAGVVVAGIDERTALIRDPDGSWRTEGAGEVAVFVDGKPADLSVLSDATAAA